jgi:hypothetical protein
MRNHKWEGSLCTNCGLLRKAEIIQTGKEFKGGWFYSKPGDENWVRLRPECSHDPEIAAKWIIEMVNNYYGVDSYKKTRARKVVLARQIAMTLVCTFTKLSYNAIGRTFRTDHTTVMWSRKTVITLCRFDPVLRSQVIELETKLE